jgi:hypothetical protein
MQIHDLSKQLFTQMGHVATRTDHIQEQTTKAQQKPIQTQAQISHRQPDRRLMQISAD